MPRIVRGALLQATWTGDKESMIQKHEAAAHEAAGQGAQVMLFQELFYGPYFCQVQEPEYYSYTELIPDGPTTKRMQDLAKQTGMVLVVPMYEEDATRVGHLLQHRRGHRRRRDVPRQVPQDAHPAREGLLGEVLLPARQHRLPGVRDRRRQGRRVHLLRPALPRGRPGAGPQRRRDGVHPERHVARPVRVPVADRAGRATRSPTATSSARSTGSASSRWARTTSTARATSCDPRGQFIGGVGAAHDEELLVRDMDLDLDHRGPPDLAVLPGPAAGRVRRPRTRATSRAARPDAACVSGMIPRGSAAKEEGSRAA